MAPYMEGEIVGVILFYEPAVLFRELGNASRSKRSVERGGERKRETSNEEAVRNVSNGRKRRLWAKDTREIRLLIPLTFPLPAFSRRPRISAARDAAAAAAKTA